MINCYTLETWRRHFEIWTDKNWKINGAILFIEVFNLVWALTGILLDNVLEQGGLGDGAIRECMRDFGIVYALMAYVFIALGIAQTFRMALYSIILIWHRETLGRLEMKCRLDL